MLVDLSPASLAILRGNVRMDVPEQRITRIHRRQTQRGRLALVGLGAGFALGVVSARQAESSGCPWCDAQAGALSAFGAAALGAGAGVIIGTFVKTGRTVYEPPEGRGEAP